MEQEVGEHLYACIYGLAMSGAFVDWPTLIGSQRICFRFVKHNSFTSQRPDSKRATSRDDPQRSTTRFIGAHRTHQHLESLSRHAFESQRRRGRRLVDSGALIASGAEWSDIIDPCRRIFSLHEISRNEQSVEQMQESQVASVAPAKPKSDESSTMRLVIRAEIIPDEAPEASQPRSYKRIAIIAGVFALLLALSWFAISAFRSDSLTTPIANEPSQDSRPQGSTPLPSSSEAVPPVSATAGQPPSHAQAPSATSNSMQTKSIPPDVPTEPSLPTPIEEVVPDVPRSALQTIRGTIRVSIQVTIDQQGSVVAATSQVPGPSRYFERLSLEAARKWRFVPTSTAEQRTALVRFHFTQDGATARAGAVDE